MHVDDEDSLHSNCIITIFQGHTDYPLTASGIDGAQRLGDAFRTIKWDFIVCSDLPRTQKTLALIEKQRVQPLIDIQVMVTSIVREVHFGIREGLHKDLTVEDAKRILCEQTGKSEDSIVDSAESEEQVFARQIEFINQLRSRLSDLVNITEEPVKVLCVSHGGFIRRFLSNFSKEKVEAIPNCSITNLHLTYAQDDSFPACRVMHVCESTHLTGDDQTVEEYIWPN